MSMHYVPFRKQIGTENFAIVEFAQGQRIVRRCMIDGKPVTKQAFSQRLAAAEKGEVAAASFQGVRQDRDSGLYEAIIGDTHLGSFETREQAQEAYWHAEQWAKDMSGHYQRACESGELLEWEAEYDR